MSMKAMAELAEQLAVSIRQHVAERLGPLQLKYDAQNVVLNDLRREVEALQAKVGEIESKSLRRVA